MEGTGWIEEPFGGEDRRFRVAIRELRLIQAKCAAGPPELARRLARGVLQRRATPNATALELSVRGMGEWNVDDVREPILQGLVGGGLSPNDAANLVREFIDDRGFKGLFENVELALTLVIAGVATPEADPLGEPPAGAEAKTTSRSAKSASLGSTGRAPRSASPRGKSTN